MTHDITLEPSSLYDKPKQLLLLASSEESFCQAAVVLQPLLNDLVEPAGNRMAERFRTGLALLEEAMKRHNAYMDSLK